MLNVKQDLKTQSCLIKYWFSLFSVEEHIAVFTSVSESLFWYRSFPRCVTSCVCLCFCVCLSMHLSLCVILSDCLSTDFAGGQTGRRGWLGCEGEGWCQVGGWWGKAGSGGAGRGGGAASQPLPSGDPDVRPWLLLDHCLYFVIDLFKAVPFHDSCSRMCRGGGERQQKRRGGGEMAQAVAKQREKRDSRKHSGRGGGGGQKEMEVYQMCLQESSVKIHNEYSLWSSVQISIVQKRNVTQKAHVPMMHVCRQSVLHVYSVSQVFFQWLIKCHTRQLLMISALDLSEKPNVRFLASAVICPKCVS